MNAQREEIPLFEDDRQARRRVGALKAMDLATLRDPGLRRAFLREIRERFLAALGEGKSADAAQTE